VSEGWDLSRVVRELRVAREKGGTAQAHTLPSRAALVQVVAGLRAALFPTHFGEPDLAGDAVDFFVGHTLSSALGALEEQIARTLRFAEESSLAVTPCPEADQARRASELTRAFAAQLPEIRELLETDIRAGYEGDPAAKSLDEVLFCYPGLTAITHHRLAHPLYRLGLPMLARILSEIAHSATGVDIHPGAQIGASFFIDHGTGVVIGETTVIGERVRLYQGVTLGAKSFPLDEHGQPIKNQPRHPIIEDDVVVYAGATILGRVTIGRGSSIGGNVWITRSVPSRSQVTQAQVRSETFDGGAGI